MCCGIVTKMNENTMIQQNQGYVRKSSCFAEQGKFEEAEEIIREGMKNCEERNLLHQAMNDLDLKKISCLSNDEKIVGGLNHPQAEKFRKLINWLKQGGARVLFLEVNVFL